ncbi:MAG TPA: CinA family protein [Candidatus Limnocylindria bacterium]|nr:CinA family protein [Candidatus Limnocylindria bacterium]
MTPPPTPAQLDALAARVGAILRERGWWLATAESSTGGLIGQAITSAPGASAYYVGGVICYSNRAKELQLDVPAELLRTNGAVSAEVAVAMAEGVRRRFGAEVGVAVTGIAGPDGATPDKPLGLHYVAADAPSGSPAVERHVFGYDRAGNRAAAALGALRLALDRVSVAPR